MYLIFVMLMCIFVCVRVFGTSMVEEYDEIADSQYTSERAEYLDEDYGETIPRNDRSQKVSNVLQYSVHLYVRFCNLLYGRI